jgi:UDPglucose 6-dehydrogenase
MKITIIGTGYVGLVTGACLADVGHDVFCLDVDVAKIKLLNQGGIPIHEPGLDEIVKRNFAAGRLQFSTDVQASVEHGDVQFIAVGTPPDEDGSADLKYVTAAARNIGKYMTNFKVIVDKSTVPVGTADVVSKAIAAELLSRKVNFDYSVSSNPEFLKEGAAIADFMHPDRIVIGHEKNTNGEKAKLMMEEVYQTFFDKGCKVFWMDVRSAEFTKYAANSMLATRISFMNDLANLADLLKVDIEAVRHGIGSDPRIGPGFLLAGCGYGGSCFPKDVQALVKTAHDHGYQLKILQAVEEVNELQKHVLGEKIFSKFGKDLKGKHFAIWGLAFKPDTDDMRAATSRVLVGELIRSGASICVYDPVAFEEAKRVFSIDFSDDLALLERIHWGSDAYQTLENADALVVVTEWKIFKDANINQIKMSLKVPVIFDGRNIFKPELMQQNGFEYHAIGRAILAKNFQ